MEVISPPGRMAISGTTKLLGIMGWPVAHSLSPAMHNAAIAALGVNYAYIPLPVEPNQLQAAVEGLKTIEAVMGFNLTIPHKEAILPFLDELSESARAIGAVNTVKRTADGWVGTNTDVAGFLSPLQACDRPWQTTPAVVLGSGGAAKAVVAGCLKLGCPVVHVVGRDRHKMKKFHGQMSARLQDYNLRVHTWASLNSLLEVAGLLVNATPVGMEAPDESPVSAEDLARLPSTAIAYDLIYTPRPTKFLQLAAARHLLAIDGLEMLLHQGAIALEFWLNRPAPLEVMQAALLEALSRKEGKSQP